MKRIEFEGKVELLGRVMVDSGQVMVCDPCYIKTKGKEAWKEDFEKTKVKEMQESQEFSFDYSGACAATLSDKQGGELDGGTGVSSSSGYGDGTYPVYAIKNQEGRVIKLVVDFDYDEELYEEMEEE